MRVPTVAVELMLILAVSCAEELNVQEVTVTPAPKLHVAPLWKLLPVMVTVGRFCPCTPEFGLTELTAGAGAGPLEVTEKPFVSLAVPLSRLITVTSRVPTVAVELMLILAVS